MENRKIRTFEDLRVYQMAREFSRKAAKLIKMLPPEEKFALASQMRRAKLSVTNNIAEGYGRYHFLALLNKLANLMASKTIKDFNIFLIIE